LLLILEIAFLIYNPKSKNKSEKSEKKVGNLALLAPDYLQLLKMVGKFIDCCLNFPSIYTAEQ
jgi:hypothetical protein